MSNKLKYVIISLYWTLLITSRVLCLGWLISTRNFDIQVWGPWTAIKKVKRMRHNVQALCELNLFSLKNMLWTCYCYLWLPFVRTWRPRQTLLGGATETSRHKLQQGKFQTDIRNTLHNGSSQALEQITGTVCNLGLGEKWLNIILRDVYLRAPAERQRKVSCIFLSPKVYYVSYVRLLAFSLKDALCRSYLLIILREFLSSSNA